jgi:anti-sigma-K factor RskA
MSTAGPDHARWADAAGAYLLGALPPGERAGFESHVEDCPVCRRDVDDLQVAAEALPEPVPPADPPPALKARIMAIVEAEAARDQRRDRLR